MRASSRLVRGATLALLALGVCSCEDGPLVPPSGPDYVPLDYPCDVSLDERWLLFTRFAPDGRRAGLYLLDLTSSSAPRLVFEYQPPGEYLYGFALSPDASRIAYTRLSEGDVFVWDMAAGVEHRITSTHGNAHYPDWDSSGTRVVYARPFLPPGAPPTFAGLYIADLRDGTDRPLLSDGNPVYGSQPQWSPDNAWITFWYGSPNHVFLIRPDGSGRRDVCPSCPGTFDTPRWTAGGGLLVSPYHDGGLLNFEFQRLDARLLQLRWFTADGRSSGRWLWPRGAAVYFPIVTFPATPDIVVICPYGDEKFGVLYRQSLNDSTGRTRRQLTWPDDLDRVGGAWRGLKDIDGTLLRENLRVTPEQRLQKPIRL